MINDSRYDEARGKIQDRIKKGLLGPGSDIWGIPDNEEIISEFPLVRYYTGVLFPRPININTIGEKEGFTEDKDDSGIDADENIDEEKESDLGEKKTESTKTIEKDVEAQYYQTRRFFSDNLGITFRIEKDITEINVLFSFGIYHNLKKADPRRKIKISSEGFAFLLDDKNIPYPLPQSIRDKLRYDGEFMYLEKELEGRESKGRSGDYDLFDKFNKYENLKESPAKTYVHLLEKLLGTAWKREEIKFSENIHLINTNKPVLLKKDGLDIKIGYYIKEYEHLGNRFIKIQFANLEEFDCAKFINSKESFNKKCLFQCEIQVSAPGILPYNERKNTESKDKELEKLHFIYRKKRAYAVGHNCSVFWEKGDNENKHFVKTTFLPFSDTKSIQTTIDHPEFEEILNIKNLSTFGLSKERIIQNLLNFVAAYEIWGEEQKSMTGTEDVSREIINNQQEVLLRLKRNVDLLIHNQRAFEVFQMTNLAMLLQLIISKDKAEKELSEIKNYTANTLEYFQKYDSSEIKYRPFQLAFLLISLEGIVNPQSDDRRNIVDLIWFPTGGGKTEAYLAVTAFTIIWRRYMYAEGYEGTSVIMRYTLRLLTAQQFERASRLISALEFLRKQQEFYIFLKDEPITIGLWVGMASTPNKVDEAKQKIDKIEEECNKRDGNPEKENIFQISSCPWCATKLITKDDENIWRYGFKEERKKIKIFCVNKSCPFHDLIPIQVVDELLYENPPTLLFGTVDKFAMLAWKDRAHRFFNTHKANALPPDLIIQDELHLISGPLGSIVGLFEGVLEDLCTKNGIPPKIISSTATTRNTENQVKQLYASRKVSIFPAAGLNYNDSFFARESNEESKKRYMGIIPTGKTIVEMQLQVLAHLLVGRFEVYADQKLRPFVDAYWTIVSYYNTLREVGKISNKIGDEIRTKTNEIQARTIGASSLLFNVMGLSARSKELTSRIESEKIKAVLKEIEQCFPASLPKDEKGREFLSDVIDLVLATNMISVGIDIDRLNIMLMNGMPKNVAEYIQATSRVGRKTKALIITIFDPVRSREKSYFEHFQYFHETLYKNVEPLSVTPFTESTIDKMLATAFVAFLRNKYPEELSKETDVTNFSQTKFVGAFKDLIKKRFPDVDTFSFFEKKLNKLSQDWEYKISNDEIRLEVYKDKRKKHLLIEPSEKNSENKDWVIMQSMRDTDTNTPISIRQS